MQNQTEQINLLRQNARSVVRELGLLNDAYFDIGVTLAERHLLIELSTCASPTAKEIAERLLIDKSTASRLIAKAVKKGYVRCLTDKKDKRRRFLELTALGKKTLHTFEPIAFDQTKDALQTLSADESELVHQGVALYAMGLRNARLGQKAAPKNQTSAETKESQKLGQGYILRPFIQDDEAALYAIFREAADAGTLFHYECSSQQEFQRLFFGPGSRVFVCLSPENDVIGGFYLRPNFSGRANHIANATYMIRSSHRGKGIGTLLVKASLDIAKQLGFLAMQFNMVLSQNARAIKLYKNLGFHIVGTLPQAIRNPDGSYQDGYIMYRNLK